MDKTNFKDAYDIGENMAVLSGKVEVTPSSIKKQARHVSLLVKTEHFLSQTMRLI